MPESVTLAGGGPPPGLTDDQLQEWMENNPEAAAEALGIDPDELFADDEVQPATPKAKKPAGPPKLKAPLRISFELPFASAMKAAEARYGVLPEKYYGELTSEQRRLAWTVSRLTSLEQMNEVLSSLNAAMAAGKGLKEWREEWIKGNEYTPLPRHYLNLVFRNHAQTAYMAGHHRAFQEHAKARPYLMYSAINDSRVRPAHAAMSGYIAPVTDPVWQKWTPPCGHNCRCTLISLNYVEAKKRGYGTETNKYPNVEPDPGFGGQSVAPSQGVTKLVEKKVKEAAAKSVGHAKVAQQVVQPMKAPPQTAADWTAQVLHLVPRQYVESVRRKMTYIKQGTNGFASHWQRVTVEEMSAVRYYMGPYAEGVNRRLRAGTLEYQDKHLVPAMQSFLSKMEPYKLKPGQELKRGIHFHGNLDQFVKDYAQGKVIQWEAFTSMSTAEGFSGNVKFHITKNKVGVQVRQLADNFKSEEEVLGPWGMQVRITRIEHTKDVTGTIKRVDVWCEDVTGEGLPVNHRFAAQRASDEPWIAHFRKMNDGLLPSQVLARDSWVFAEACAALGVPV